MFKRLKAIQARYQTKRATSVSDLTQAAAQQPIDVAKTLQKMSQQKLDIFNNPKLLKSYLNTYNVLSYNIRADSTNSKIV